MYRWYQGAAVCFVYLADVTWVGPLTTGVTPAVTAQFSKSRWFTRGWTLQELLAPRLLVFFTLEWRLLGSHQRSIVDRVRPFHEDEEPVRTSAGFSLSSHIELVTGISVFSSPQFDEEMQSSCIARKMSWASRRSTTRLEDTAYSLLGIFGVNMPLLYGEGKQAFIRLQEELIRRFPNDQSILAWQADVWSDLALLLAPSPEHFEDTGAWLASSPATGTHRPHRVATDCLEIRLRTCPHPKDSNCILAVLDCGIATNHFVALDLVIDSRGSLLESLWKRGPWLVRRRRVLRLDHGDALLN